VGKSCAPLSLCVEAVEKVPKQILGREAEKSDLIECATINDLMLGKGQVIPENIVLIRQKDFSYRLVRNEVRRKMKNTQKPRKTTLFILMFTLPLTAFYFSPVIVQFATWNNTFALGHTTFLLLFLSTIFLGRTWCSYICPFGAFQDVMAMVIPLRQTNNKCFKNLRQIIVVLWLTSLLYPIAFIGFKKLTSFSPSRA
jgi:polyferredoxin